LPLSLLLLLLLVLGCVVPSLLPVQIGHAGRQVGSQLLALLLLPAAAGGSAAVAAAAAAAVGVQAQRVTSCCPLQYLDQQEQQQCKNEQV
jgi:hypothetical protein